jgi:hypothetical protein
MLYFLLHDADTLHRRIAPALARSWRQRNFGPVVALASYFAPVLAKFADCFHLTADERPLLSQLTADQPFHRRLWRHLAGEVLLYAAADAPSIQTAAVTLAALVAPHQRAAVRLAHVGSRDLDFDGVLYRPGHAGLNGVADVARLTDELSDIDPAGWNVAELVGVPDLDDEERADELAFARECFAALRSVYEQAQRQGQVVVCEEI